MSGYQLNGRPILGVLVALTVIVGALIPPGYAYGWGIAAIVWAILAGWLLAPLLDRNGDGD